MGKLTLRPKQVGAPDQAPNGIPSGCIAELLTYIQSNHRRPPLLDFRNSVLGLGGVSGTMPQSARIPKRPPVGAVDRTTLRKLPEPKRLEQTVGEEAYYRPFAAWLTGSLGEATVAEPLGGNALKGKWGTPDVLGVLKPVSSDPIKFETEIVAAEIKLDPSQPIVAFGQAVAYRLFSHKSYMALPETISADDLSRLEALSMLHGIGLVTFSLDPAAPNFSLKVRAQAVRPNPFFMNQMARRIRDIMPQLYDRMF